MRKPATQPKDRRVALWLAVGSTMLVIVTLWALVLPKQLAHVAGTEQSSLSRWYVERQGESEEDAKSFQEILSEQREHLKDLNVGTPE